MMTNATPHLLIVDDDREIVDLTSRYLRRHGFRTTGLQDSRQVDAVLDDGRFDLVILDLMMPGEDGLSICRRLRTRSDIPIIMLTALGEETDRIVGLEIGADDYIPKPFNPRELLARIKAVLRRTRERDSSTTDETGSRDLEFAGWSLSLKNRELRDSEGEPVKLTSGEFDLLAAMVQRPGRTLSRDQLLDLTRGRDAGPFDRSIDVLLSRLRRKIEDDPQNPRLIKTVRNGGYVLAVTVEPA